MENIIRDILVNNGVKKNVDNIVTLIMLEINKPKNRESHDSYIDDNGITWIYCSRHKEYHEENYMVKNKSRKNGYAPYCKQSQIVWERLHRESNLLKQQAAEEFMKGNTEKGQELMKESEIKSIAKNMSDTYKDVEVK